ncbi:MAG: Fe-S cluster assembly protein SufB, partial [Pseudomonadota bacterium]
MSEATTRIDKSTIDAAKALETYKYGFTTDIESEKAPKGLSADTIRYISAKKEEPEWMLDWRLKAYERWLKMDEPTWAMVKYPKIDYQDAYYYSAPKTGAKYKSLDDVPAEILADFEKLGISLKETGTLLGVEGAPKVAVEAVFDSVS